MLQGAGIQYGAVFLFLLWLLVRESRSLIWENDPLHKAWFGLCPCVLARAQKEAKLM